MSTVVKTIFQVLQPQSLEEPDHFKNALSQVSNFRYAIIHERENLPQLLQGKTIPEIEATQEKYSTLVKSCLEWIWICQSHIDNPKSDRCFRERTKANFPTIQQEINEFQETRKSLFPNDILPEGFTVEPSYSEPKKKSEEAIFEKRKPNKEKPTPVSKKPAKPELLEFDEVEIDGLVIFLPRLQIDEPA